MNITKIGHCCLLIKGQGKVILTDPGAWTTEQNTLTGIDIILITHEHADHFHLESLKIVLQNNPQAIIVTNSRVAELLTEQHIPCVILEHSEKKMFGDVEIAAFGVEHANIYPSMPNVMNTGFLIASRFFYAGDAFTNPGVPVEILAVPMIGPWMKLAEAIDWAKEINPKVCIPVHDGVLNPRKWIYALPSKLFPEWGIAFDALDPGESKEY